MKVSIILPISNDYLNSDGAIISLINQTYKNIEILICLNGNSKKFNTNIKKKFKKYSHVKFYYLSKSNIVDALNLLVIKSSGKYIARMDADDFSHPERISKQIEYIKSKKIDFLSTMMLIHSIIFTFTNKIIEKNIQQILFYIRL